jgi:putative membrane protein
MDMMYGYGMGWWGWLMMFLFWVPVVLLIVWAVRPRGTAGPGEPTDPSRILDERFARGEIELEEYRERRAVLDTRR